MSMDVTLLQRKKWQNVELKFQGDLTALAIQKKKKKQKKNMRACRILAFWDKNEMTHKCIYRV